MQDLNDHKFSCHSSKEHGFNSTFIPLKCNFFIARSQSEPFMASIALFTATTNLDKLTYYISEQKYHLERGWQGGINMKN